MIREARQLVRGGTLGQVRKVVIDYSQGWLSQALEKTGHKQAAWRSDPLQSGVGGAIGGEKRSRGTQQSRDEKEYKNAASQTIAHKS